MGKLCKSVLVNIKRLKVREMENGMYNRQEIVFNTDNMSLPTENDILEITREKVYEARMQQDQPEVSIFVLTYNRLEKVKLCVESILQYTKGIDFELVIIDNGSESDIYDYYKTIQYEKKRIIRITKNIGALYATQKAMNTFDGKYFVLVMNDIVVTTNWLTNMLTCIKSDRKIGWVVPKSTNVSNLQQIEFEIESLEDLQEKAKKFNVSDPKKWEERLRVLPTVSVMTREVIDMIGTYDAGFFHDFSEDDLSLRLRRNGYKMMLCGDTFVHHNHNYKLEKDPIIYNKSLEMGRKNFLDKYHGLDAWDDILNFEFSLINRINRPSKQQSIPKILGIDVKCGTPILEIRNRLRKYGIFESESYAFTQKAKYYEDLLSICEQVNCDRLEYIEDYYMEGQFDYIILGESINLYNEPIRKLSKILSLARKGSNVLFKLRNTRDFRMIYKGIGGEVQIDQEMPIVIDIADIYACLKLMNVKDIRIERQLFTLSQQDIDIIKQTVTNSGVSEDVEKTVLDLLTKEYSFVIEK